MLQHLQRLYEQHGWLSAIIIDEADGGPGSGAYRCRFGSLLRAYTLVGYTPDRDFRYIEINRRLRELHPRIVAQVVAAMQRLGGTVRRDPKTDLLTVNDEFTVSLVIARCLTTKAGHSRWAIRLDTGLHPDLTVAVRVAEGNHDVLDYYLLPSIDITVAKLRLAHDNGVGLDAYRFDSLDYLFGMAERVHLREAA
jgi:hypothetical protein